MLVTHEQECEKMATMGALKFGKQNAECRGKLMKQVPKTWFFGKFANIATSRAKIAGFAEFPKRTRQLHFSPPTTTTTTTTTALQKWRKTSAVLHYILRFRGPFLL
jgi:hypothetical protein